MNLKHKIKWFGIHVLDFLIDKTYSKPIIEDRYKTLITIIEKRCSVTRFGDGELGLIFGRSIGFQQYDPKLAIRLKEILNYNDNDELLICLSKPLFDYKRFRSDFYCEYRVQYLRKIIKLLEKNKQYFCADFTRFYNNCYTDQNYINRIKEIWGGREILLIEGTKTRMGIGNDLFDNASSVKRILCPPLNAFSYYEDIYKTAINNANQDCLILIALGPTATVLAYDLYLAGYQAVDIGHIDISYEWYLRGVDGPSKRIVIPGKYVNEVRGGNNVGDCVDQVYLDEIIAIINESI